MTQESYSRRKVDVIHNEVTCWTRPMAQREIEKRVVKGSEDGGCRRAVILPHTAEK